MQAYMDADAACWLLPDGLTARDVAARFERPLRPAVTVAQNPQEMVLHDTFAWQLWHQNMLLCQLGDRCLLCGIDRHLTEGVRAACEGVDAVPRFWWDWPPGAIRDALRGVIGIRALTAVARVTSESHRIDLRNDDDKTVVRILVQRFLRSQRQALTMCRVEPIRGYDRELAVVVECLSGFQRTTTPPLRMILEQCGHVPEPWTPKPACPISSDLTVREATRRMAAAAVEVCRRCEPGIIDDVDSEFLHDYRVSLRRLRSLLKLVKHVYPADVTCRLLSDLSDCARRTNRLRDLDVYLLNRHSYLDHLPPDCSEAMSELFADLQRERDEQRDRVAAHLQSGDYHAIMGHITEVFDKRAWYPMTVSSAESVSAVANRLIPKRYKKVCQTSSQITATSPDAEVHSLRLQAKKLRYLLEFFGDLYAPESVRPLTKRLKKLQNVLGTFNDLAVQQSFLRAYVRDTAAAKPHAYELALGVGSLLGILHRQQTDVRHPLQAKLAAFTNYETRNSIQELRHGRSGAA